MASAAAPLASHGLHTAIKLIQARGESDLAAASAFAKTLPTSQQEWLAHASKFATAATSGEVVLAKANELWTYANGFVWNSESTWLASPFYAFVLAPLGYLSVILLLRLIVGGPQRSATAADPKKKRLSIFSLDFLSLLHNIFLCALSAAMAITAIVEIAKIGLSGESLTCQKKQTGLLAFTYYVYHLSKYYELLDTVILVLKRKPLIFLHVWHHMIMIPLTWTWMNGDFAVQYWGVIANTVIHVAMYYYYSIALLGKSVWWKKYLTGLQILQFVSVFVYILVFAEASYNISALGLPYSFRLDPQEWIVLDINRASKCIGDALSLLASFFVNITFLTLFTNFFIQSYLGGGRSRAKGASSAAKAGQNNKKRN